MSPLRWFISNLSTLILAFALSLVVWISAVTAADPNIERNRTTSLQIVGLDPNIIVIGNVPTQVRVTLEAPTSVMESMNTSETAITAWIDLSGLGAGTYDLEVQTQINPAFRPVRRQQVVPDIVTVTVESLVTQTFPVDLEITGDPAIGYQKGAPGHEPASVTISGPANLVERIADVHAEMDISGAVETVRRDLPLVARGDNGGQIEGVTISPPEITAAQPVFLQGGYRNVIVRVVTEGQPADGYKLTNVTVSPLNVVVFSSDPQLVNDLPGYVETKPVDLSEAEDDLDTFIDLDLPEGVSVAGGDQFVLVQVSIAAIEGSLKMTLPVTPVGLVPIRAAHIEPATVDVILLGPLPMLDTLTSEDIRVIVDLTDFELGVFQLEPQVDVLPERIEVEAILPSTVLVEIIVAPTPTPTSALIPTPIATPQP
jgi:YbbR domain-containing protein